MKAIILAAGRGSRLDKYTKNLPKCMLKFEGKALIQRQVETMKSCGIKDITIVKGYKEEKITIKGVKYYVNKDYQNTNMVYTLFCAEKEMDDEVIVSYGDIIYEKKVLQKVMKEKEDVSVTVDTNWKEYWKIRYGNIKKDTESLVTNKNFIIELGISNPPDNKIDGRYVGLLKFSKKGINDLRKTFHELKEKYRHAFMTDIIQELINRGIKVKAAKITSGWLEFDTNEDYEKALKLRDKNKLKKIFHPRL